MTRVAIFGISCVSLLTQEAVFAYLLTDLAGEFDFLSRNPWGFRLFAALDRGGVKQ